MTDDLTRRERPGRDWEDYSKRLLEENQEAWSNILSLRDQLAECRQQLSEARYTIKQLEEALRDVIVEQED